MTLTLLAAAAVAEAQAPEALPPEPPPPMTPGEATPGEATPGEAEVNEAATEPPPVEEVAVETPTAPSPEVIPPAAPPATPPTVPLPTEERLGEALVEYNTAWRRGVGFLVGDRRTVIVLDHLRDRYRRITAQMSGGEGPVVRVREVELATEEELPFVILHLDGDLPGQPLELSPESPEVGDELALFVRQAPPSRARGQSGSRRNQATLPLHEPARAVVTAASEQTLTVGAARSTIWGGSPILDAQGRVVAFFGDRGYALRASRILAAAQRRSGRRLLAPIFGVRVGTEFRGLLEDPFAIDFEAGLAIWDQLGIVFRLGLGLGADRLERIASSTTYQTGVVEREQSTINLSLELKYRLLITRAALPLYLDVVAGLQYTTMIRESKGLALYSTTPGCDPIGGACDLSVGPTPGRTTEQGVGMVVGFDIRAGIFTMGYRFVAEALSHQLPDTHRLTFGLTYH